MAPPTDVFPQRQVVGSRLAAGSGQDLDHPEQQGDLGYLGGDGLGEDPGR